jgi:hypothetical protein
VNRLGALFAPLTAPGRPVELELTPA